MTWLIYGASGHTGALIAEQAQARGQRPILAGRSAARVAPLAERLGLEYRVVDLGDGSGLRAALDGVDTVAHCAGPFSVTASPMVDACLDSGTNYLDITGEIDVFESIYARHEQARAAGVVLLPGAGFDVVPTDCVAAKLVEQLPGASRLDLAFKASANLGPGTVKTALEGAGLGNRARVGGRLRSVRLGHRRIMAGFSSGPRVVTSIPWGDVSSAYRSTAIPDIVTYTIVPAGALLGRGQPLFAPLLRKPAVQERGKALVDRFVPRGADMAGGGAEVWGQASDDNGNRVSLTLRTPGAIPLTAHSVVAAAGALDAGATSAGAHTPSTAFGSDFALGLEGVRLGAPVVG